MEDAKPLWWETDPEIAEVVRRFNEELEARATRDEEEDDFGPDPILNDVFSGASRRALATARDDLEDARRRYEEAILAARAVGVSWGEMARILGVSRQALHRRFARAPR